MSMSPRSAGELKRDRPSFFIIRCAFQKSSLLQVVIRTSIFEYYNTPATDTRQKEHILAYGHGPSLPTISAIQTWPLNVPSSVEENFSLIYKCTDIKRHR